MVASFVAGRLGLSNKPRLPYLPFVSYRVRYSSSSSHAPDIAYAQEQSHQEELFLSSESSLSFFSSSSAHAHRYFRKQWWREFDLRLAVVVHCASSSTHAISWHPLSWCMYVLNLGCGIPPVNPLCHVEVAVCPFIGKPESRWTTHSSLFEISMSN